MRVFLIIAALLVPSFTEAVPLVAVDQAAHFGVAFAAQATCAVIFNKLTGSKTWSNIGCFTAINAVGIAKELTDKSRGDMAEYSDLGANALGSASGAIVFQWGF